MVYQYQFEYWSRYVARVLRVFYEYRGPLVGWKLSKPVSAHTEGWKAPEWKLSEVHPWNIANRLSRYPYPVQL